MTRRVVYAALSEDEWQVVRRLAAEAGQSVSAFMRGCLNDRIAEASDSAPLLQERRHYRPRVDAIPRALTRET